MKSGHQDSTQKVTHAYFIAFLSAVAAVGMNLTDAYISRNVITVPEGESKVVAACVYLTLGGVLGSIIFLTFACSPLGNILDPEYTKLRRGSVQFQKDAFISGSTGALSTGIYLYALQKGFDVAMVTVLGSSKILWCIAYEYWHERRKSPSHGLLRGIVGPAILLVAGMWVSEKVTSFVFEAFLLICVAGSLCAGISNTHEKFAIDQTDGIVTSVWRFMYLGTFGTLVSIFFAWQTGKIKLYVSLLGEKALPALLPVGILMTFAFITSSLGSRAKKELTMGASRVALITQLSFVGVLIGLSIIQFGLGRTEFGQLPTDSLLLVRKVLGAAIITASVIWMVNTRGRYKRK